MPVYGLVCRQKRNRPVGGEVISSFVEVWLKPEEIEATHKVYGLMNPIAPVHTQILISLDKSLPAGHCKVGLSSQLDRKKAYSSQNSFAVSEVVAVDELDPQQLLNQLLDKANKQRSMIKWQVNQARRREWLFGGGNSRVDGLETKQFDRESVKAL